MDLPVIGHVVSGLAFMLIGLARGQFSYEGVVSRASSLFGLAYGLLWLLLPPLLLASGGYWWSEFGYSPETIGKAFLGYLVFGVAALAACMIGEGKAGRPGPEDFPDPPQDLRGIVIGLSLLTLVALGSAAALGMQILSAGGFAQYLLRRNEFGVGSGLIQLGLPWFGIIAVVLAGMAVTGPPHRRRAFWIASAVFLVLAILVGASTGSRTRMLQPVLLWVMGLLVMMAPKGIPRAVKVGAPVGMAILLGFGMLLGIIREQLAGGSSVEIEIERAVSLEVYQEFENGWWLVENQAFWEPLDGASFAAGFVFPIPRALWPEKPVGSGALMVNLVRPRSIVAGIQTTRSPVTTGLPPESFLNFGWLGFPVIGLLYGAFLAGMNRLRLRVKTGIGFAMWAVLMVRSIDLLNMEFFGWVANFLYSLTPFLLLYGVLAFRKRTAPAVLEASQ